MDTVVVLLLLAIVAAHTEGKQEKKYKQLLCISKIIFPEKNKPSVYALQDYIFDILFSTLQTMHVLPIKIRFCFYSKIV